MQTDDRKKASDHYDSRFVSLCIVGCLALVGSSLGAEEKHQEHIRVVDRPVVVVKTGEDRPVYAWSFKGNRSFLGVQSVDLTPELRRHFGVPEDMGILISKVVEESPAAESGLQVGDIVTAIDGEGIRSPAELAAAVRHREVDDAIDLEVWRGGEILHMGATLTERQGPWVDVREFHFPRQHLEGHDWTDLELEGAIELDTVTLNKAILRLNEEMSSPEWRDKVYRYKEHQGDLMERIEMLEQRLQELESELEELPHEEE